MKIFVWIRFQEQPASGSGFSNRMQDSEIVWRPGFSESGSETLVQLHVPCFSGLLQVRLERMPAAQVTMLVLLPCFSGCCR
jgi:hypothetical protein